MNFNLDDLSDFSIGDFNQGFGNYADIGSMTDGLGTNLFSDQLSAFQPTWGQQAIGSLNGLGQSLSQNMPLLNAGASVFSTLGNLYSGNKQMKMYKDSMNQQSRQWQANYDNQVQLTNERLADRQRQRVAANPNATSEAEYMRTWGVK